MISIVRIVIGKNRHHNRHPSINNPLEPSTKARSTTTSTTLTTMIFRPITVLFRKALLFTAASSTIARCSALSSASSKPLPHERLYCSQQRWKSSSSTSSLAFSSQRNFGCMTRTYPSSQNTKIHRCWMSSSSSSSSSEENENPRDFILNRADESDHPVIDTTLQWLQNAVIGLNFCPFAERPLNTKKLFIEVVWGTNQTEIMARILSECLVRQKQSGTTLIVCPDLFPSNFLAYLEVYQMMQDGMLVDHELTEDIQIAPFHPKFEFDGSGSDGIDNFTNRSPYPIFHILREEEVANAVELLDDDASKVWKQNIQLLEELSEEFTQEQIGQYITGGNEGEDDEDSNDKVHKRSKEILKQIKKAK